MAETHSRPIYPLGNSSAELDRLARQAQLLRRATERMLRDAGIAANQRVLDIGSGGGDVALLVSDIVGPGGEVIGIERSAEAISRARERVRAANLHNVQFAQGDVADFSVDATFDAAVGRYILMFVADAVSVIRAASARVRPGGSIVFIETSFDMMSALSPNLPLWQAAANLTRQTLIRCGGNPEMGVHLYAVFQAAGLPAPHVEATAIFGLTDAARWRSDVMYSNLPTMQSLGLSLEPLGDLQTLAERLESELREANAVAPIVPLVAAWCVKP